MEKLLGDGKTFAFNNYPRRKITVEIAYDHRYYESGDRIGYPWGHLEEVGLEITVLGPPSVLAQPSAYAYAKRRGWKIKTRKAGPNTTIVMRSQAATWVEARNEPPGPVPAAGGASEPEVKP